MMNLFQVQDGQVKHFELDARAGLNGARTCWSFPCVLDESRQMFFVWLGDVTIERFSKTTFLNLANFAEANSAKRLVLVQFRDHVQKVQFQKLFKVLDAERVSKRGMQELMGNEHLEENVEKYAIYRMDIQ